MKETLAKPSTALYTRLVPGVRMHKTATQEKQDLIRRFASGEIAPSQVGKKLVDLDRKNRTKKVVLLSSLVGFIALILAPFLVSVGHMGSADSRASQI